MESTEVYTARSWSAIPQDDCKEITKLRLKAMIFGNAKQWISSWIYTEVAWELICYSQRIFDDLTFGDYV